MSAVVGIGKVLLAAIGSSIVVAVLLLLVSLFDLRDFDDLLLLAVAALLVWICGFVFLIRLLFRKARAEL